jgi:hypothetical protein
MNTVIRSYPRPQAVVAPDIPNTNGQYPRQQPATICRPDARRRRFARWLRSALDYEANARAALPEDHPRRRPTLPRLAFLEQEDRWQPVGTVAADVVADLDRRRR